MVTVCDSNFLFGEGERERSAQRNRWCWIDRLLCEENEKQKDIDSKVDSEYFVLRKTFFDPFCYLSCLHNNLICTVCAGMNQHKTSTAK